MRLKITPLLLIAIGLLLYGLYLIFLVDPGEEGWGILFGLVFIAFALGTYVAYVILRLLLKSKLRLQIGIELMLLMMVLFFIYKTKGGTEFDLPDKFRGYIVVIYNVPGAEKLEQCFFTNKIKIHVPPSGIVLTSSGVPSKGFYGRDFYIMEGVHLNDNYKKTDRTQEVIDTSIVLGFAYGEDVLVCKGKKYIVGEWLVDNAPGYNTEEVEKKYKLPHKLDEACKLIERITVKPE